jgi:threonine dehydrogenase-like Zn-dependent dehydrogenase
VISQSAASSRDKWPRRVEHTVSGDEADLPVLGCKVIATASTVDKRRICTEKGGADEVVDYGKEGWQKEVLRITGGKGVDVVFDPVGTSSRPTHFHPCSKSNCSGRSSDEATIQCSAVHASSC